jgi:hypothetical protein
MKTKLLITEKQYKFLKDFILESKYDDFIINKVKKGDTIRISWKNNVSNFKVVDVIGGQVQMDNIDAGSTNINYRYLLTQTSLDNDKLEVKRVHKIKEKDKLNSPSSWSDSPVTDIKNIELVRNNDVVDSVDDITTKNQNNGQNTQNEPISEEASDRLSDILGYLLDDLIEGDSIDFSTNEGDITLNCIGANKGAYTFDSESKQLSPWDSFNLNINNSEDDEKTLYELNSGIISTDDDGKTYNIKLIANTGDKQADFWVKSINNLDIKSKDSNDSGEDSDNSVSSSDAKKMMQMIISDPLMKQAFYKNPTLWNVIVSAVKGEKPRGTGIVSAYKIIGDYRTRAIKDKIGPSANHFKMGRAANFKFIEQNVSMNPTGQLTDKLELPITSTFRAVLQKYKLNDDNLVLSSSQPSFKIVIKKEIENLPNSFEVEVVKEIKTRLGIKTYTQPAKVRFESAQGTGYYNPDENKTTTTTNTNK